MTLPHTVRYNWCASFSIQSVVFHLQWPHSHRILQQVVSMLSHYGTRAWHWLTLGAEKPLRSHLGALYSSACNWVHRLREVVYIRVHIYTIQTRTNPTNPTNHEMCMHTNTVAVSSQVSVSSASLSASSWNQVLSPSFVWRSHLPPCQVL